jgi:hypothetical protein
MPKEISVGPNQPASTDRDDLWVDTDDYSSAAGSLSAWTPIPLASGFISYGSGLDPQYRIEPGGIVRLRGWIKPASGNFAAGFVSTIATLPVEARPGRSFVDFACVHGTITTTAGRSNTLRMEITGATGDMGPRVSTSPAYEAYSWIGLDGITYTLEP